MGLAFIAAGAMKLTLPKRHLTALGAGWVRDFTCGTVRFVGFTEVLGGVAILLPAVFAIPLQAAVAAGTAGLIVVMLGAAVIHARRREPGMIVWNLALLALVAAAVWHQRPF